MSGGATKTAVPRLAVIGLATSMLGMAALPFAVTGTNLAIPLIKEDFGSSLAALSWTLSGYSIIIAALTMLGGVISVRIGTLRAFQIGIGIFVAASAVCAFAPNIAVLIGGRIFQGMGGALVVPASISVALVGWPEERRAFAIGVWTGAFPIGSSAAPIVSSALITGGQWRFVFAVPLALGVITLGLSVLIRGQAQFAASNDTTDGLPDFAGMLMGTVSTGLLALGLVEGNTWGWTNVKTLIAFAIAALLIPLLISRSGKHKRPFLPVKLFRVPTFRIANIANVSVSMIGMSVWLVWPLVLGGLWKYDAWGIGLAMSPTPFLGGAGAFVSSWLVARFGYRQLLSTGAVALVLATGWFMFMIQETPHYWTHMFPGLVLTGIGMGLLFSFLNAAALVDLEREDFPAGNATFSTGRFLSGAVGIAAVVAMIGSGGNSPVDPFRKAYGFLFGISIIAFLAIIVLWPRKESDS